MIRRAILAVCGSASLNEAVRSLAMASLSLPVRKWNATKPPLVSLSSSSVVGSRSEVLPSVSDFEGFSAGDVARDASVPAPVDEVGELRGAGDGIPAAARNPSGDVAGLSAAEEAVRSRRLRGDRWTSREGRRAEHFHLAYSLRKSALFDEATNSARSARERYYALHDTLVTLGDHTCFARPDGLLLKVARHFQGAL